MPRLKHPLRDRIFHEKLNVPYLLNVRYKRLKRPFATTYIFIHGLADTGELWKPFLDYVPKNSNYIVVDLLGHGGSYVTETERMYSAREQARHVLATIIANGLSGPVILVGHSFGSLVSIEFADMYRGIVKREILVAPPIYRDETKRGVDRIRQDNILRNIYRQALRTPDVVIKGYGLYGRLGLAGFSVTQLSADNFNVFRDTLLAGIISQRAATRLAKTSIRTDIVYGKLDPFVIESNLKNIQKKNDHIALHPIAIATHAIRGKTEAAIVKLMSTK